MNACDWKKYPEPVFSAKNGVYAPGHNANFYSPDGKETWNVYHAVGRRERLHVRDGNSADPEAFDTVVVFGIRRTRYVGDPKTREQGQEINAKIRIWCI